MAKPLFLSLAYRVQRLYCLGCERLIWRWQGRCGFYHTSCKHAADDAMARVNGLTGRWVCNWCGR